MYAKLLIALALVAAISALVESQPLSLADEHEIAFNILFKDQSDKPMEAQTTKFHLSRMKRIYSEAKAKNIALGEDDESQRDMLDFLVGASHLTDEKCHDDNLAEYELFAGYMQRFKNIVEYLNYFTQKQIGLCKSLGIEVNV